MAAGVILSVLAMRTTAGTLLGTAYRTSGPCMCHS